MDTFDMDKIGPELLKVMEQHGIHPDMTDEDLERAVKRIPQMAVDLDPVTFEKVKEQAEATLGLSERDKADFDFMMKVMESAELNAEFIAQLGITENALQLFVEKAYSDAVNTCDTPIDEVSFKLALLGGLIYGKEMTERRHA